MKRILPFLAIAASAAPAADVAPIFPAPGTEARSDDGAAVRVEDGVAVVDIAAGGTSCGVKFVPAEPFALDGWREVRADVSNRTDRALDFTMHTLSKGTYRWYASGSFRVEAGESRTVSALCRPSARPMAPGGDGLPGLMGYDRAYRPDSVDASALAVEAVVLYCRCGADGARFDVRNVRAEGALPSTKAVAVDDAFLPFVDEFGQFAHDEWPGKIHSVAELRAAEAAEETELAAHPESPIPGADRFGGWGDGPQLEATGLFRTEKRGGRWWLVDPDGHLFFSLGCNYVRLQGKSPVTDREKFFSWLPDRGDPLFGDCWSEGENTWNIKCFYRGRGVVSQFDFAKANQKRLHGDGWEAVFAEKQHRRMRSWGFTSMGNWSDPGIMALGRTPYVDNFNLDGVRKIEGDSKGAWRKFPDVFADDFAEKVVERAHATRLEKSRTDPWCIGWFVENELHWGRGYKAGGDIAAAAAASPEDQPARIEWLRRLRAAHGPEATFADATEEDVRAFEAEVAERYFSTVKRAIETVAPGRLYLGCRFCDAYPDALRAAARWCDVVSYNCYRDLPEAPMPADAVDKPAIVGEFHFGSLDRGGMHAGIVPCPDMASRMEHYQRYVRRAVADERIVGVHWFFWYDMPLTGWMDGEDYANGVMDVAGRPHPEMVEATRELARELYAE